MTKEQKLKILNAIRNNPQGFSAGLEKRANKAYRKGDLDKAFALMNLAAAITQGS